MTVRLLDGIYFAAGCTLEKAGEDITVDHRRLVAGVPGLVGLLARKRIAEQAVQAWAQVRRERGGLGCVRQAAEKLLPILRKKGLHTLTLGG